MAKTGRRTLLIGESGLNYSLLANHVSKLFPLSFGIASIDVHGVDAADCLLHIHVHRVVRGT